MATQKPISTISYNTEKFLREKLDEWYAGHIIQAYQYIFHKGEDGDKDHIHLRIEPNKKLDPMVLQEELREFQFGNDKPLGCRPFRPSKEEDWILYAVHDEEYLQQKYQGGEKGEKMPYSWQDIVVPEYYDMETAFIRAKAYLKHSTASLVTQIRQGANPLDLALQGENVYNIRGIISLMNDTDYKRLRDELDFVQNRLMRLVEAVEKYGLDICVDNDGNVFLQKIDDVSGEQCTMYRKVAVISATSATS